MIARNSESMCREGIFIAPGDIISPAECIVSMFHRDYTFLFLQMEAVVYFCEPSGTCRMQGLLYDVPLIKMDDAETGHSVIINHDCKLP